MMKIVAITTFLTLSMAQALAGELKSALNSFRGVALHDGSVIARSEISAIGFSAERENKIEFLELKDSTYIDTSDISKIFGNNTDLSKLSERLDGKRLKLAKSGGDGSGG
jgi:hypothetical protein